MTSSERASESIEQPIEPWRPLRRAYEEAMLFLQSLSERPVSRPLTRDDLRKRLNCSLPEYPQNSEQVLADLIHGVESGLVASAGPRYFGFVMGGGVPVAVAADWMTSVWDQNAFGYVGSPAAAVVEEISAQWLLELLRLPPQCSVGFVSGGQMANFTGLAAARDEVLHRLGWSVSDDGLAGAPVITVVASEEAHVTIDSALRMLGIGARQIRRVRVDAAGRMSATHLASVLKSCGAPVIVCCQLGNVNTGAFDPAAAIIAEAHEHGAWVHVDGTFGLWAATHERYRSLVEGYDKADSWTIDGHKWLNVPYDSGFAIVADRDAHRRALATTSAHYLLRSMNEERHASDWVPESSRRARAFPVYAALSALGRRGVAEMVERCCTLACRMADHLRVVPGIAILNDVVLNQVLVRFRARASSDPVLADQTTLDVVRRIQVDGTCWAGSTRWQGQNALRISVSNWLTTASDIDNAAKASCARTQPPRRAIASSERSQPVSLAKREFALK